MIRERNYLDVYVYDKWNGNHLPEFQVNERFQPDELDLREGRTTQPALLTEADLVSLMDKNGIGAQLWSLPAPSRLLTSNGASQARTRLLRNILPRSSIASMSSSSAKARLSIWCPRRSASASSKRTTRSAWTTRSRSRTSAGWYVFCRAYLCSERELSDLCSQTEERLVQICDGTRNKHDVITQTLDEYREMFYRTRHQMQAFVAVRSLLMRCATGTRLTRKSE